MIGKIVWVTIMLLTTITFIIRSMQGLPIAKVFYETSEVLLINEDKQV